MRVGMGYDVHRLAEGRKLIIGGVDIPYEKGLLGHSDADVLLHAISDSLLGAAALGDIGKHFPDNDPKYKGADSLKLLEQVGKMIDDERFIIQNIDATIVAQAPKMKPHYLEVRKSLNKIFKIGLENISFKSKSHEGLGDIGNGNAMQAFAVVNVKINTEKKK